jgi:Tol biopolymer transport system component
MFASLVGLVITLIASLVTPLHGQAGSSIELISATPAGVPAGGQLFVDQMPYDYGGQHVSGDNRYVVFASPSSQIVAGDTNGFQDDFVRDRVTGTTTLVSRTSSGAPANGHSNSPVISANGRYVAFTSQASNLVPTDTNGALDVFVRDLQAGTTTLVSVSSGGAAANYGAYEPSISADGRYIAFESASDTLVPGDTNVFNRDIFVRDTLLGTTERVSLRPDG